MDQSQKRIGTADLLKGIAVVLMIQVHLTELFSKSEIYSGLYGRISLFMGGPPAAPLFMMVMGYFIVYKTRDPFKVFIRGLKLFAGGILLNIALNLNLLLSLHSGRFENIDPWNYILGVDILPLAGLSLIIMSFIIRYFRLSALYFAAAVIITFIHPYLPSVPVSQSHLLAHVNAFFWGNYDWSYFPVFPWLAYPLAGAGFYFLRQEIKMPAKTVVPFLLLWGIFIVLTIGYGIGIAANLREYYHHDTFYFIWVLIFLSGFSMGADLLEKSYPGSLVMIYLKFLGRNVTAAYVFQWIIIGNIATELFRTQALYQILIWLAVILTVVSFLVYMFQKYSKNIAIFIFPRKFGAP